MRIAALLSAFLVAAAPARADESANFQPNVAASVGVGLAFALVPVAIGSGLTAGNNTQDAQNAGIYLMCAGLAVAPVISHLIAHEWKRAALFGALPTAALVGMALMLEVIRPQVVMDLGYPEVRIPFASLLIVSFFSAGGGLADSLMAGDRARDHHVTIVPTVGNNTVGIAIGGTL
jgi:hypothetical protein